MDRPAESAQQNTQPNSRDLLPPLARQIILQCPNGIMVTDKNGTALLVNDSCRRILRLDPQAEITGHYNILHDEDIALRGLQPTVASVFDTGENAEFTIEYSFLTLTKLTGTSHEPRVLQFMLFPIRSRGGEVEHVAIHIEDQTKAWRDALKLADSEARFRRLVEDIPDWLWLVDSARDITYSSPLVTVILGYDTDELMDTPITSLIIPEDRAAFSATLERLTEQRRGTERVICRFRHKDGAVSHIESSIRPVIGESGDTEGFRGVSRDVSERVEAQRHLESEQALFRVFLEHAPAAIAMFDKDMRYIAYSKRWLTDYGIGDRDITGLSHYEVFPEIGEEWKEHHRLALSGQTLRRDEDPFPRKDGSLDWVKWELVPWHQPDGSVGGIIMFTEVITERKHQTEELERRNRQLELLSKSSRQVNSVLEVHAVLRSLITTAMELTGATAGASGLLTDGKLSFKEYNRQGVWYDIDYSFEPGRGVPGLVMQTRTMYMTNDAEDDPHVLQDIRQSLDFHNLIDVPVISGTGELLGALELHNKSGGRPFDDTDATLLQILAANAAVALQNARVTEERRRAEAELADREALLSALIDNLPFDIWAMDTNGRYTMTNATARKHWGDIVGHHPSELGLPKYVEDAWVDNNNRVLSGEVVQGEIEYQQEDGRKTYYSILAPIKDQDRISGLVGINIDITERKQAEESTRESERRLSDIISFLPDATVAVDLEGRIITWNKAMEELTGVAAENMIGKGQCEYALPFYGERRPLLIDLVLHPSESVENLYASLKRIDSTVTAEVYMPRFRQGAYIWAKASPLYDAGGRIAGAIESIRDITDLKKTEEELRKSEEKFRSIFENSGLGIFQSTPDGRILNINPSYARIYGYDSVEDLMSSVRDVAQNLYADPSKRDEIVRQAIATDGVIRVENEYVRKDGRHMIGDLSVRAVRDGRGNVLYLEGFVEDITERRLNEQRQRELEAHKREFYRRTILAATEGKLEIAEPSEICKMVGPPIARWDITQGSDLSLIRHDVTEIALRAGMDKARVYDLTLCVGELTTNAYKHAGGGKATMHSIGDILLFVVSDHGPGIEALTLPAVALKRGFTTARSLGMGYKAMLSIADKIYLATGPGAGTTVAIEMTLHPQPPPTDLGLPDTWA